MGRVTEENVLQEKMQKCEKSHEDFKCKDHRSACLSAAYGDVVSSPPQALAGLVELRLVWVTELSLLYPFGARLTILPSHMLTCNG